MGSALQTISNQSPDGHRTNTCSPNMSDSPKKQNLRILRMAGLSSMASSFQRAARSRTLLPLNPQVATTKGALGAQNSLRSFWLKWARLCS